MTNTVDQEELALFRDAVIKALETEVAPHYEAWEKSGIVPRELWNTLGAAGMLCVDVPEDCGGCGAPFQYSVVVGEELARMGFGALSTNVMVHSDIVAPYLSHIGNDEQKQQWLPKMVSGEAVGAIAMTEPGAGSDLQAIRTSAVKDGDDYILNGSKTFITNGQHADMVIVAAKTDPNAGAKGISLFRSEQKQQWLPKMVSGEAVGAIAMTEPGAGSDLQAIRTSAVKDGDDYILNGSKTFITNGQHADMVIVAAKTDPNAGAKGISLFLVDTSLPGFSKGRNLDKIGQHSGDTSELFFSDMRIPASALLGEEGQGFVYLMRELPRERLVIGALGVAAARGSLDMTIQYTQERELFGQKLSQLQNTRFEIARMETDYRVNRAFVDQCIREYEDGKLDAPTASMAKYSATEMQCRVADGCLQLFGGYGYTTEYPISRNFIDARVQRIYGGTSEVMKEIIARSVLGR